MKKMLAALVMFIFLIPIVIVFWPIFVIAGIMGLFVWAAVTLGES